ncbi:transcription factor [Pyrenophora seminiperda CCB06]|uniref:Transcription factor n=1 Tax=Pyrenophora seminiperda CCB06 TaxID=1302712 RepID=A0A3M7M8V5_9PLEO|nr:transcription factor [Pyrenophora seminiperda CCB06]
MEFEPKSTGFDDRLTNSWSFLNTSRSDQITSATPQCMLTEYTFQLESQNPEFVEMHSTAIGTPQAWYPSSQYANHDSHLDMTPDLDMNIDANVLHLQPVAPMHAIWDVHTQSMSGLEARTIVPHDSMLGGDYIRVHSPNLADDSYDDADVPFEQHTAFKQEPLSPVIVKMEIGSDDEGQLRRSICETRTGSKSVKLNKEQRRSRVSKDKAKERGQGKERRTKSKSKFGAAILEWDGDRVETDFSFAYRDENKRWHPIAPHHKFVCKHPFNDDEEVPEGESFCGKQFKRTEHQQRHKNTHKPSIWYPCLLCDSVFNRNDNRWAHGWTHVREPGKGDGRNEKYSLRQVISVLPDPKHIEYLLKRWRKDVGADYIPEDEEDDSLLFVAAMQKRSKDMSFTYDANMAVWKIRSHRLTHLADPVSVS